MGLKELLLTREGRVYLEPGPGGAFQNAVEAAAISLAGVGVVPSQALRERLLSLRLADLATFRSWALATLTEHLGGHVHHVPLFRSFPDGIPEDTRSLWWSRVLIHFLQAEGQPCLFCRAIGTTHLLDPCAHVVCDQCFDGANYSACPICNQHINPGSPFLRETDTRRVPTERVRFKLLDLGEDIRADAERLFRSLCARTQPLSPTDRDALGILVDDARAEALKWIPEQIPLKENVAFIFGGLLLRCDPALVMPLALKHLKTATDVLRLIAVMSGTDGSLLPEIRYKTVSTTEPSAGARERVEALRRANPRLPDSVFVPQETRRFKVVKLPRSLRRSLLGFLDGLSAHLLTEDLLRHRSYWVWVGEFLHPHEYAKRFPRVAAAFQVLRKQAPDGTQAPRFRTWNAQLENAIHSGLHAELLELLGQRSGEFARRLDLALRSAPDERSAARVAQAFAEQLGKISTPLLLTLRSHLPLRATPAALRVFWPKSRTATGVSAPDRRPPIPAVLLAQVVGNIDVELLRRFAEKTAYHTFIIDDELRRVLVPFNERTASRSAVALPRGSRLPTPNDKDVRLFLHWCQPEGALYETDLDLSVGFYDAAWQYLGVCSYYQLTALNPERELFAVSAGDLTDAPWPDGASEFIDVYRQAARSARVRYAVMVVNAYSGMTFGQLEHSFAGLMFREDLKAAHFDPRTVELRFNLAGDHGIYLPLVLDLELGELHWLDVHAPGQFQMNNVATSNRAITTLCPNLMRYFASGTRPSLHELGLLHAAARGQRVLLRGAGGWREYQRAAGESPAEFFARISTGDAPLQAGVELGADPACALLCRGDLQLPDGSSCYALFRESTPATLAASDLLS